MINSINPGINYYQTRPKYVDSIKILQVNNFKLKFYTTNFQLKKENKEQDENQFP